jgi:predicted flap endonuclease-1-like 5' DNA nuclease
MSSSIDHGKCTSRCWVIAIAAGIVIALLLMGPGSWGFWGALVVGLVVFAVVGIALPRLICSDAAQATTAAPRPAAPAATPTPTTEPERVAETTPEPEVAPEPTPDPTPEPEVATESEAAPEPTPEPEAEPETAPEPVPEPETGPETATEPASVFTIRPTQLPGQQELAARKGSWRYAGVGETVSDNASPDATPGEVSEADTAPDDLKRISGIGPALERKLLGAGVTTFAQIAGWSDDDVANMDDLLSFRGRITREDWIGQARILASGGETEFSGRQG